MTSINKMHFWLRFIALAASRNDIHNIEPAQFDAWEDELKQHARLAFRVASYQLWRESPSQIDRVRLQLTEALGFPVEIDADGNVSAWVEDVGMMSIVDVLSLYEHQHVTDPLLPLSKVLEVIAAEPELPGPMPATVLELNDRIGLEEHLRYTVRQTKVCIMDHVRKAVNYGRNSNV